MNRSRLSAFYSVTLPLLVLAALAAAMIGSARIDWSTVARVAGAKMLPSGWIDLSGIPASQQTIVWMIRLPRVLIAATVGAGFAMAGAQMQGLFRNALAEPSIVGVSAGAMLGAIAMFLTGLAVQWSFWLPIGAFAGALAALAVVYAIATRGGVTPVANLLLAGVALSALLGAVSSLLLSLNLANWQTSQEMVFWMMGGLDGRTWTHFWLCAPFVLVGAIAALIYARDLDLLMQGEETAAALGVDVEASKRIVIAGAALLTGSCVAVSGQVGFVGLIIPHLVRLVIGPGHRALIPASAVAGAVFLILCDLAARSVHPPNEIRLGIITGVCGAPFFLFLLMRRYREVTRL